MANEKAKTKTIKVGQVLKSKDGKSFYIKFSQDLVIKKGEYLSLEDPKLALKRIKEMVENGKISEEKGKYIIDKLSNTPEYVKFEVNKKVDI